jgi:hypothetical protein
MGIVDELLAAPGLYVGRDSAREAAARILVTVLPGGAGVSLDYEVLNPAADGSVLGHSEHTLIGRADGGQSVMIIAHVHGAGITFLHETDPGTFELTGDATPFPMKVVVSVPTPGRIRHAWWYGRPGDELQERDVAEVALVPQPW